MVSIKFNSVPRLIFMKLSLILNTDFSLSSPMSSCPFFSSSSYFNLKMLLNCEHEESANSNSNFLKSADLPVIPGI